MTRSFQHLYFLHPEPIESFLRSVFMIIVPLEDSLAFNPHRPCGCHQILVKNFQVHGSNHWPFDNFESFGTRRRETAMYLDGYTSKIHWMDGIRRIIYRLISPSNIVHRIIAENSIVISSKRTTFSQYTAGFCKCSLQTTFNMLLHH